MTERLHDIQISPGGQFIIGASPAKHLLLVNTETLETTGFSCERWDLGGARIAVTDDGSRFYTAAYHVHGVTAWRTSGPLQIWQRKDLKKTQHLALSSDGTRLFASVEGRGTFLLCAESGTDCGHWRGIKTVIAGPGSLYARAGSRLDLCRLDGALIGEASRKTSGVLSAAFGASVVCFSEVCGPVSFFSTASFEEVWRYDPPPGSHVLRVSFRPHTETFIGIQWEYERGGPYRLIEMAPSRRTVTALRSRASDGALAFFRGAEWLFLGSCTVESLSGSEVSTLGAGT